MQASQTDATGRRSTQRCRMASLSKPSVQRTLGVVGRRVTRFLGRSGC